MDLDVRPLAKRMQEVAMWGEHPQPGRRMPWQEWNPERFDARAWVDLIKASGARYFCFITMHAWSWSNFDHPATRFDILSTPFGRDVVAELGQAARDRGIAVFWYHNMFPSKHIANDRTRSALFWSMAEGDLKKTRNWEDFRRAGLHALVLHPEKYGKVAGIWCDGGGTFTPKGAKGFYTAMCAVQPWLIFTPRHGHPDMPKDYRVPEQKLAPVNWRTQQEMTMPLESDLWFWALGKKANTKDAEYVIQTLIQTATRDANLMINVSPRGDGAIDATQAQVLRELGAWTRTNGEAIFGTRAGPYAPGLWGGSTRDGHRVYLHLTQLAQDGAYALPPLPAKIRSARLLSGGPVKIRQTKKGLRIQLDPALATDKHVVDRIVVLELADDAWAMLPEALIPVPRERLLKATATASSENRYRRPSGKPITNAAQGVMEQSGGHGGWSASEPWSEAGLDPHPWLMLDFGADQPVRTIWLKEFHSRIQEFVLESRAEGGEWRPLFHGRRLNHLSYRLAQPVTARFVRLRFPKCSGGAPQIAQFRCYK
jgi:alpha-L-fucosidase